MALRRAGKLGTCRRTTIVSQWMGAVGKAAVVYEGGMWGLPSTIRHCACRHRSASLALTRACRRRAKN